MIVPLDCTEGFVNAEPFRQLTSDDISFIHSYSGKVDFIKNGQTDWIIFRDFSLPEGYNVKTSDMAIMVPKNYPIGRLDMFYLSPSINRKDGKII